MANPEWTDPLSWETVKTRCPDHADPLGGDIVGCGHEFEAVLDEEGLADCPECGIVFSPAREAGK